MRSRGDGGPLTGRLGLGSSLRLGSRSLTRTLKLGALASLLLCAGCPREIVLPDERIPHQVAEETTVVVWCHDPKDGARWVKCEMQVDPGWWLASPQVADPAPEKAKP